MKKQVETEDGEYFQTSVRVKIDLWEKVRKVSFEKRLKFVEIFREALDLYLEKNQQQKK